MTKMVPSGFSSWYCIARLYSLWTKPSFATERAEKHSKMASLDRMVFSTSRGHILPWQETFLVGPGIETVRLEAFA